MWIALKDLLQAARDGKGLLMLIVMPLVLIAILGAAFGGQFSSSQGVDRFALGFVNEDGGVMGDTVYSFLSEAQFEDLFAVKELTAGQARDIVAAGDMAAVVIVPSGFSENFMAGESVSLELLVDRGRYLQPLVAESVLQSFAESLGAGQLVVVQAMTGGFTPAADPVALGRSVAHDLQQLSPVILEEFSEKEAVVTSFQYYTAAMAVMFLLFAGMTGLQSIIAEQRIQTFHRLAASPLQRGQFILGKFFGILAISFTQFLVLMAGTRFIYGVSWGSRPWEAAVVALAFGIAVSGLSLMASALIREEKTLLAIWPIWVQISSALGGSMVPLAVFPPSLQVFSRFTPNYWGLQALTEVMMGRALNLVLLVPLLATGIVAVAVASLRMARV
jgi:ABC-2 type transport system permease protein